ncbi:family 16 glycosylhydrolase [Limibacter armeniacum]|uniref:family 16 glycosylhydrolase n=1 Tax=Limibacter armeniacum TaxID=466084 RepID=UPI002FE5C312
MKSFLSMLLFLLPALVRAQDWKDMKVPAPAGEGMKWELQEQFSDDFNYEGKGAEFEQNWKDVYFNKWLGPGLTEWNNGHSEVTGGNLQIKASRKSGTDKVYCGVVTSKETVMYPVYMEASIKVSNQVLSSNFWMLSDDDTREIDALEVYGGDRPDQTWFAANMSTNYHIFERDSVNNSIIANHNKQTHHHLPNNEPWRNDYHTFGVYWKSATEMTFYIDGEVKNTFSDQNMTDPSGKFFDRPLYIIIDIEDHDWRSNQGTVATDEELADDSKNVMYVDWVRVYKPVESNEVTGIETSLPEGIKLYPNPAADTLNLSGLIPGKYTFVFFNLSGEKQLQKQLAVQGSVKLDVAVLPAGYYQLLVKGEIQEFSSKVLIR